MFKAQRNLLTKLVLLSALFLLVVLTPTNSYNYDHVNVTTRVNVTNAQPEILATYLDGSSTNITLNAGGYRTVNCNATIRDYNGFNDIDNVNATFYYYLNLSGQNDDNNEHYTNASCSEVANDGQYLANYSCTFQTLYFANNGTWFCNISVNDSYGYVNWSVDSTSIAEYYALNVTDIIDYGDLYVTEISTNVTANITNFGNTDINVSVLGYGQVEGDGLGFVCTQGTNITVENQRFSSNSADDWAAKTPLSSVNQDMQTTLLQQKDDATQVKQTTYWQLYVPPNPFGECFGVVRFTATLPIGAGP